MSHPKGVGQAPRFGATSRLSRGVQRIGVRVDALAGARRALHLDRECPVCHAAFSEPCRSASGQVRVQVHAARERPPGDWVQQDLFGPEEISGGPAKRKGTP